MSKPAKPLDEAILGTVARYYSDKVGLHGPTARGVDWNSEESQALRFAQLLLVMTNDEDVSLLDYGCGYGALLDSLRAAERRVSYVGFDISAAMISAARQRHVGSAGSVFTSDPEELRPADYGVASGIFNVRLRHPEVAWRGYVNRTLETLNELSRRGFAFNMLSTYSDSDKRRTDLYYADPLEVFDFCKRRFSSRVSLIHDYPLFEFTMIVRK